MKTGFVIPERTLTEPYFKFWSFIFCQVLKRCADEYRKFQSEDNFIQIDFVLTPLSQRSFVRNLKFINCYGFGTQHRLNMCDFFLNLFRANERKTQNQVRRSKSKVKNNQINTSRVILKSTLLDEEKTTRNHREKLEKNLMKEQKRAKNLKEKLFVQKVAEVPKSDRMIYRQQNTFLKHQKHQTAEAEKNQNQ